MTISTKQIAVLGLVLILMTLLPWLAGGYMTGVFTVCLIYAIWCMAWDFFSGLSGRENFGYPVFIGIGAYVSAYLNVQHGVSPWLGLVAAVITAMVAAIVIGLPTLRLSGPYFALTTMATALITQRMLLIFWDVTGGEEGIQDVAPLLDDPRAFYYLVLAATVVSGTLLVGLANSRWGLLLRAIRGDEASCKAAGINVTFYKMAALVVSAGFAGMGGALYANYQMQVSPQIVSTMMFVAVVTMVYVGGIGSVYGAAGGAIILSLLGELLRSAGEYRLLVYALLLIIVVFYLPNGLIAPQWRRLGHVGEQEV